MLYPFSLTLDLYIQAESFEEAKKLAEAYVQDASLDTTDYPEIVQDMLEVAEGYPVDVDWGTQGFYRCNDAGTLPGECADFIFHKCND